MLINSTCPSSREKTELWRQIDLGFLFINCVNLGEITYLVLAPISFSHKKYNGLYIILNYWEDQI